MTLIYSLVFLKKDPFHDEDDEDDEEEADHRSQSHHRFGHQAIPLSVGAGPQTTCLGSYTWKKALPSSLFWLVETIYIHTLALTCNCF